MLQNPCVEGQVWGPPAKSPPVLCSRDGPDLLWPQGWGSGWEAALSGAVGAIWGSLWAVWSRGCSSTRLGKGNFANKIQAMRAGGAPAASPGDAPAPGNDGECLPWLQSPGVQTPTAGRAAWLWVRVSGGSWWQCSQGCIPAPASTSGLCGMWRAWIVSRCSPAGAGAAPAGVRLAEMHGRSCRDEARDGQSLLRALEMVLAA